MKYGYIMEYISEVEQSDNIASLKEAMGSDYVLYEEKLADEESRPKWKEILNKLKKGDELYLVKFANAIRSPRELSMLLEICTIDMIHVVSVFDKLDSNDPQVARVFSVFGSLSVDIATQRTRESKKRTGSKKRSGDIADKKQRNAIVEQLYVQGVSIEEIMRQTHIRSNSTVYRILEERGANPKRRPDVAKSGKDEKKGSRKETEWIIDKTIAVI